MLTLKIEFDTVAVTDAVRQLPNSWACSVSDKYDIIKTAYITSRAIITCCDIAGANDLRGINGKLPPICTVSLHKKNSTVGFLL